MITTNTLRLSIPVVLIVSAVMPTAHAQETRSKSYSVLSGVGLALNAKDGHIYVGKSLPKSPADESGLIREGARLASVEVDGAETSLDGKTVGEAASLLRGPVDTDLILTVVLPFPLNDPLHCVFEPFDAGTTLGDK